MRRQVRTLLVWAIALATASIPIPAQTQTPPPEPFQVQAPVFRSGTYVVPVGLVLAYKKQPWTGLTAGDVTIVLDKVSIAPLEMQADDKTPNHYTVYFQPPDTARDGKTHVLEIKVRKPNSKSWTTLPFKAPITLPKRTSGPTSNFKLRTSNLIRFSATSGTFPKSGASPRRRSGLAARSERLAIRRPMATSPA